MNNEEKYSKVIGFLKGSGPVMENKERMKEDIMREINGSKERFTIRDRIVYYLFGWVDNYWLRGAMATAAILFTGIFIIQQVVLANRINHLEKNLIRSVNNVTNAYEPDQGISHKVLLEMVFEEQAKDDSITVSRSDLLRLLKNYQELLDNYDHIKQDVDADRKIRRILRHGNGKNSGQDES